MAEVLDVKRRDVSPIESLTLKLTGEEAEVLYFILRRIGGSWLGPRAITDRVMREFAASGVPASTYDTTSMQHIYFDP